MLAVAMGALAAQGKDVYVSVDFLDEMGLKAYSPAMTADHIRTLVKRHRQAGVKGLLWRVASLGLAGYPTERMTQIGEFAAIDRTEPVKRANGKEGGLSPVTWLDPVREPRYVPYYETFKGTMAAIDPFAEARRICREEGVELYFWVDLFDEMFGKFLIAHPECLVHTPDGARYPGLRDYANATAVREKLDEIAELYRYKPDGLYLSTSCHSRHLKFTEPNGAFGVLPGATFTAFLAQLKKECAPHGVKLMIGTPLGGTLPFCSSYWSANEKYRIEIEWKRWIDEGIADSLVFGDYETLWDRLGFWMTKPEPPAEGVAPVDFYAPEYVRYAKGRVKLYLFSGWLGGNASAEMARCAQYAKKHGLDGFFAHESATIETVAGAFEGLRKAHDAMNPAPVHVLEDVKD